MELRGVSAKSRSAPRYLAGHPAPPRRHPWPPCVAGWRRISPPAGIPPRCPSPLQVDNNVSKSAQLLEVVAANQVRWVGGLQASNWWRVVEAGCAPRAGAPRVSSAGAAPDRHCPANHPRRKQGMFKNNYGYQEWRKACEVGQRGSSRQAFSVWATACWAGSVGRAGRAHRGQLAPHPARPSHPPALPTLAPPGPSPAPPRRARPAASAPRPAPTGSCGTTWRRGCASTWGCRWAGGGRGQGRSGEGGGAGWQMRPPTCRTSRTPRPPPPAPALPFAPAPQDAIRSLRQQAGDHVMTRRIQR